MAHPDGNGIPPAHSKSLSNTSKSILQLEPGESVQFKIPQRKHAGLRALAYFWGRERGRKFATRLNNDTGALEIWRVS